MLSRRTVLSAAAALPFAGARAEDRPTVLRLHTRTIEVNGKPATVYGITQPDGTRGIVTRSGARFHVRVENQLGEPSLIHWHGLTPPWQQDGVPGISGPPIPPGGSALYDFPLRFGGTFWMHSHEGLQEQRLLSAPLLIHDERDRANQQEIVLMLADFSFTPAEEILTRLRRQPAMPPMVRMAMATQTAAPDLNDVTYDAFLANDRTLADPQVVPVEPGGAVLLRIINSSAMSAYHIDLGALAGELVAVDGFAIHPVRGSLFPIAVAQRLDIRMSLPKQPGTHPVLAQLEGGRSRTGILLRAGRAPVPHVAGMAEAPSPALTLDLERTLRPLAPLPPRQADRVHRLDLTGKMGGYVWSINNVAWTPQTPPLPVRAGERVELVLTNRTRMPHPMHLHGHEIQVVEIDGQRFSGAVRDTVLVPPSRRVVLAFEANNPGHWAFHCHLLYHLEAGMFTTLQYG